LTTILPEALVIMNSKKRACELCQKKLALSDFSCRCGGLFCAIHRPDAEHKCSYDYRAENFKALSTNMKVVIAKKVEAI